MIDFGLAKKFRDLRTRAHISYREDKNLTGERSYIYYNFHSPINICAAVLYDVMRESFIANEIHITLVFWLLLSIHFFS